MAYTRPWNQVMNLPGSRDADEIDDENREGHTDFTERFGDILYDVEADPWVLKVPGVNLDGTQAHRMAALVGVVGTGTANRANPLVIRSNVAGASVELFYPVIGPQGSLIRAFSISGYRTIVGATVQAELWEVDTSSEVPTNLATISLSLVQATIQSASSGVIDVEFLSTRVFYIRAVITADVSGISTAALADVGVNVKLAGTP